jgi:hypothetical protein
MSQSGYREGLTKNDTVLQHLQQKSFVNCRPIPQRLKPDIFNSFTAGINACSTPMGEKLIKCNYLQNKKGADFSAPGSKTILAICRAGSCKVRHR